MGFSFRRIAGMAFSMLSLLLCDTRLPAQTKFTLIQLADSAKKNLPLLLQKQALAASAKAGITEARHTFLPSVQVSDQLSVGSSNALEGTYLPITTITSVSGSIRSAENMHPATGNIAGVYGQYEVYNFGLRGAKIDNAIATAATSEADYQRDLYNVQWQIAGIYLDIIRTRHLLSVDAENILRYSSIDSVITALTASGIKAGVDSSLSKAELSRIRVAYNQRAGQVRQLFSDLTYFTGIPADMLEIDTSLTYGQEEAGIKNFPVIDSMVHPLVDYFLKRQQLFLSTETLVKKSFLPKILLGAGGWARGSSIQFNDDYKSGWTGLGIQRFNYSAGIGIIYDLFNGTRTKDKLNVARYQTKAGALEVEQQKSVLQNTIRQSEEAIRTAEVNLKELPVQIQAAMEAYQQKMAQYKAGMINLIDLTNASFVLYSAQLSYADTLNAWLKANLNKAAASGNLELFIQKIK